MPAMKSCMPDPSYPCNRHFVSRRRGRRAVLIPTTAAERLSAGAADKVAGGLGPEATRGVLLASPSQPDRHLDPPRSELGASSRGGPKRAAASRWSTRSISV
jgi:hypothetical protein